MKFHLSYISLWTRGLFFTAVVGLGIFHANEKFNELTVAQAGLVQEIEGASGSGPRNDGKDYAEQQILRLNSPCAGGQGAYG